jgi:hypothetical protein
MWWLREGRGKALVAADGGKWQNSQIDWGAQLALSRRSELLTWWLCEGSRRALFRTSDVRGHTSHGRGGYGMCVLESRVLSKAPGRVERGLIFFFYTWSVMERLIIVNK